MENVRRDPGFAARWAWKKALLYWRMWLHPAEHGPRAVAISAELLVGLFVAGIAGLVLHRDRRLAWSVIVFFVAMALAHVPYIPTLRLRIPLTDPLLIVFAAGVPRLLTPRTSPASS